jgi:DNA-binding NtrC family response regulator
MQRVLAIDNDAPFLRNLEVLLCDQCTLLTTTSGHRAVEMLRSESVDLVLLGPELPDMGGRDLLRTIHREIDSHLPVVVVTDRIDSDRIVEFLQDGAYDFISKNVHRKVLSAKILKAIERRLLEVRVNALQSNQADQHDSMVFASSQMRHINFEVTRLASLPFDVLLLGETGVGKDLIAFELHRRSKRRDGPFISLPMRALNESILESELFGHEKGAFSGAERMRVGKLEAAHGGTLYIPEISSLTEASQLKLLHFLQYKNIARVGQDSRKPDTRVDVRIVMATNESLEEHVTNGRMREDFYHRITGVKLYIPPLRERLDDIGVLAQYFLQKHSPTISAAMFSFSPEVDSALRTYRWPGNVRELENAVKSAIVCSPTPALTLESFPQLGARERIDPRCHYCLREQETLLPHKQADEEFRRAYFLEILRRTEYNMAKAAKIAGMTVQGFRRAVKALGISPRR